LILSSEQHDHNQFVAHNICMEPLVSWFSCWMCLHLIIAFLHKFICCFKLGFRKLKTYNLVL
jgi:hypothetical protein